MTDKETDQREREGESRQGSRYVRNNSVLGQWDREGESDVKERGDPEESVRLSVCVCMCV